MSSYDDYTDDEEAFEESFCKCYACKGLVLYEQDREIPPSLNTTGAVKRISNTRKENDLRHSYSTPNISGTPPTEYDTPQTVNQVDSESDDEFENEICNELKMKTRKKVMISDSEPEDAERDIHDLTTSEEEHSLHSLEPNDYKGEIGNISGKLNNSGLSDEFFETLLETGNGDNPTILIETETSLKKSVEASRVLKQMKESATPTNSRLGKNSMAVKTVESDNLLLAASSLNEMMPSSSPSPSTSVKVASDDEDVVYISTENQVEPLSSVVPAPIAKVTEKTILYCMVNKDVSKTKVQDAVIPIVDSPDVINVFQNELQMQKEKVRVIENDLLKAKNIKGRSGQTKRAALEKMLRFEAEKLSKMVVRQEHTPQMNLRSQNRRPISWDELKAKAGAVLPKTFGKQAMSTYNAQKSVILDRLQQLHESFASCPKEENVAEDPKGLTVELMPHQKRALAWFIWRENQEPSGGILADDMGLGKTLSMISLILKTKEIEDGKANEERQWQRESKKYNGGTLVVCPATLINQWAGELKRRTDKDLVSYELYHGSKRETKPEKLMEYDMVITTFAIVLHEQPNGAIFRVKWRRIIVDEAHQIRNHKSLTFIAMCKLAAKSRWALTGTPVQNTELDIYSLLIFLRVTPFDELQVWKRWVGDKSSGGGERLHTVLSSLMLRRTKAELMEKGTLSCIPERKWELISVKLNKNEMDIYQNILIFSRTLFAQFLQQRTEKQQIATDLKYTNFNYQPISPNQEYSKIRQKLPLNKVKEVKGHEILLLILRLRQICCHAALLEGKLDENSERGYEEYNLHQLDAVDEDGRQNPNMSNSEISLGKASGPHEGATSLLNPSNPVFLKETLSSKIKSMFAILQERVLRKDDKAIIVSQWPSFLNLIAYHLNEYLIPYDQLDGSVPVHKRMGIVDRFNDPKDSLKILLLSLTAGGQGLNLVGANHLFLLDLHWNPQLENQAQDRIYRVGQQKPVFIYKFMAVDTIEKRILELQEKKLDIANSVLTGLKQVSANKLSLDDLKLLFDM